MSDITFEELEAYQVGWRTWVYGDRFEEGCGGHLYYQHPNQRTDIARKAEKAWYSTGHYQVVHSHPANGHCEGDVPCAYFGCEVTLPPQLPQNDPDPKVKALVKGTHPHAKEPQRTYKGDAGFDLTYPGPESIFIDPGEYADVPCGVAIQWPDSMWSMIIGRSSSFRNRGLLVNTAIIDNGFRGELFALVRNIGNKTVEILPGERVAQVIPMPLLAPHIELALVDELDPSDRGENGFGSTGA